MMQIPDSLLCELETSPSLALTHSLRRPIHVGALRFAAANLMLEEVGRAHWATSISTTIVVATTPVLTLATTCLPHTLPSTCTPDREHGDTFGNTHTYTTANVASN